jgi:hypothetical protein
LLRIGATLSFILAKNSSNVCYHSVKDILCSSLPSENMKIKIRRIIILAVVLYGREAWSLILREEHGLRVSENRVLRTMSGRKGEKSSGRGM